MNNKIKALLVVAAVAVLAGAFWVDQRILTSPKSAEVMAPAIKSAPVSVSVNGKKVEADEPVRAQVGSSQTLSMTSKSKDAVTVTVPGLQDTPVTVEPGQDATLDVSSQAAGTFPIIEHGTMPNTRSVEGGTTEYDLEAGTIQFK